MAEPINTVRKSKKNKNTGQKAKTSDGVKLKIRRALSGWPMILAWLAMLVFAFHASTHMVGAGDTWVAMACGRHFINHGVDTVEPFSANSHKAGPTEEDVKTWPKAAQWIANKVGLETVRYWHPTGWVNQNWLTHVIFYWLTHKSPFADAETFSFNTLVYWKVAIYILAVICVYYTGKILGANPALSAVFACFAMFIGRSFFDIRPAGFSNLLVAVFLLVLVLSTYRNILYIWLIVPLVVFWCNVHGGYIYAFIMLVPFVALNFLTGFFPKRFTTIGLKGLIHTVAAGFAAFLAAIIFNPFHLTNLTHTLVISFSEHAEMWRTVNEWHPAFKWSNPVGTGFPFLVLLILSIGLVILWLFSRFTKPRFLKAPKNELETQRKLFTVLSTILGGMAAVLVCWVTFISFSFVMADAASFFICAIFVCILLLSIYKSIHFIYLTVLLTLLALWSANADTGYTGRYIYPFIILPTYVAFHIITSVISKTVKTKPKDIALVILTAIAALVLMTVLINPFGFEKPFWNLKQFMHLQRIWRPPYESNLGMEYAHLFGILYIVNAASVIIWLIFPYLRKIFQQTPDKIDEDIGGELHQLLPKIDLSLITIAALTIYMAYRSRRFIPIAAIAACPVLAMFIDQIIRTISAVRNFHKQNRLSVPPMPRNLQMFFLVIAAVAVSGFGIWWGLKFKRVYLDPWPSDTKLNSVFMRMTASDAKPFYACKFIKDNKLKGKMFNYWTEGGFIAWGQEPDPNTGKTPLQLFMDGRAQAAYEPETYELWSRIMSGGPTVFGAKIRKRTLSTNDYTKVGKWIAEQLRKHDVWVVLMPLTPNTEVFVRGLEHNPNWPPVFFNNKQKLFVDIKSPQGQELFEGIFNGRTVYPDEFSKNLVIAHNMLMFGKEKVAKREGLGRAIKAFELNPSQAPIIKIISASKFSELRPTVDNFCKGYLEHFVKHRSLFIKQDGYYHRAVAAIRAVAYLQAIAKQKRDTKLVESYAAQKREYDYEAKQILKNKKW